MSRSFCLFKNFSAFVLTTGLVFTVGCAVTPQGPADKSPRRSSGRDDFGGSDTGNKSTEAGDASAAPAVPAEEKRVAVILGPGGYKTFAHTGVLKEMHKANIPVHKVVGIEWGAVIGGLYAQRGQINEAEWKLYKLERLDLDNRAFFASRKEAKSTKILQEYLRTNLEKKDITQLTVSFTCPSLALNQGVIAWLERGSLAQGVEGCLASPPLFKPEKDAVAGLFSYSEAISRLRREGYNVIILVNVLGGGNLFDKSAIQDDYANTVLWNEARRALWQAKGLVTDVVDVNTRGIAMGDFESRKLLVTAGEAAGERLAKQLAAKYNF